MEWGTNNASSAVTLPLAYTTYYSIGSVPRVYNSSNSDAVHGLRIKYNTKTNYGFTIMLSVIGGASPSTQTTPYWWTSIGF